MAVESLIKRYEVLVSKIMSSGYASKFGKYDQATKRYDLTNLSGTGMNAFNYFNNVSNKNLTLDLDAKGVDRNNGQYFDARVTTNTNLEDLINNSNYLIGDKSKILRNICNSLFNDDSVRMDYTPKEVMNCIEKVSNGKITFTYTTDPSKLYINPGTFKSIFYKAKKEYKKDFSKYENLSDLVNDLVVQRGIVEKENLCFDGLDAQKISSLFLKSKDASNYELFKSLKDYDSMTYESLHERLKEIIPKRTFKRIISNSKESEYESIFKNNVNLNEELFKQMIKENMDKLIFDPFNSIKYQFSSDLINMTQVISDNVKSLLGSNNSEDLMIISSVFFEKLAVADNPHCPFSLKGIKEVLLNADKRAHYLDEYNNFFSKLLEESMPR